MVTLRSSHRTTAFHQPEARGHFLRFALSQPLSRTHAHIHTRIRTLTRTEKHSTSFQPLSSFRCRLSSFPSPPQPLLPSLSVPVPLNGPSFTLKCSFPPCSGGGKRSRRISRRVCIRLPSSFSPPPLPLPPLPPSAVLAHVERATHTRANTYTHTRARARTEIGHAQLSLATFLTPTIGEGASGEGLRERAALDFRPFPFSRARLNGFFLAANMADDAMRLATAAVASVLDGLSDADARRRDANLAAAPPPRRRRRSPAVFRFVLANDPAFVRTTR